MPRRTRRSKNLTGGRHRRYRKMRGGQVACLDNTYAYDLDGCLSHGGPMYSDGTGGSRRRKSRKLKRTRRYKTERTRGGQPIL